MPVGSTLLFFIKRKLMSLFDDVDDKPLHPSRDSTLRPLIFPKSSGSSLSYEHPDKERILRDIEQQQAFERLERFLQSLRSNLISPVKYFVDIDKSFIALPLKQSSDKRGIFPTISGNFFSLEQPTRSRISSASKLILGVRLSRLLQPFRSNRIRHLRFPRDA